MHNFQREWLICRVDILCNIADLFWGFFFLEIINFIVIDCNARFKKKENSEGIYDAIKYFYGLLHLDFIIEKSGIIAIRGNHDFDR